MVIRIQVSLSSHLLCEGIKRLVDNDLAIAVCEEGHSGGHDFDPDIVLFDAKQSIGALAEKHPNAKFILIDTGLKDVDLACLLLCHHISGIIPPEADLVSFYKALQLVHAGEVWIEQKHIRTLIDKGRSLPDGEGFKGLSDQDKKIVGFITQGYKNSEIARLLCLSEATIKAHVSRIYRVLRVKNRAQLVCLARDNSLN